MAEMNGQDPQHEEEGQEGAPPPQPEAPQEQEQAGQRYDYDPELVRMTYEENKRRERELDRREREWEQKQREQQTRYPDFADQVYDPVQKAMIDWMRRADERERAREEREQAEREQQQWIEKTSVEMESMASYLGRQAGMTPQQVEALNLDRVVLDLYKDAGAIRQVGVDHAMRKAFEFATTGRGRSAPQVTTTRITPRTAIVTAQGTGPVEETLDAGPQRQGESNNDYAQRIYRAYENSGLKGLGLKDGQRLSSE